MTSSFSDYEDKPRLIGSMHKYSDGYGYGKRVETTRNISGEKMMSTSTTITMNKDEGKYLGRTKAFRLDAVAAEQRCEVNRNFLASGEYGKFHFQSRSVIDSVPGTPNQSAKEIIPASHSNKTREVDSSRSTARRENVSASKSLNPTDTIIVRTERSSHPTNESNQLTSTSTDLRSNKSMTVGSFTFNPSSLDPSFGRSALRDVAAVERIPTSRHEKLFHISASQQSYDLSASFARGLRPRK